MLPPSEDGHNPHQTLQKSDSVNSSHSSASSATGFGALGVVVENSNNPTTSSSCNSNIHNPNSCTSSFSNNIPSDNSTIATSAATTSVSSASSVASDFHSDSIVRASFVDFTDTDVSELPLHLHSHYQLSQLQLELPPENGSVVSGCGSGSGSVTGSIRSGGSGSGGSGYGDDPIEEEEDEEDDEDEDKDYNLTLNPDLHKIRAEQIRNWLEYENNNSITSGISDGNFSSGGCGDGREFEPDSLTINPEEVSNSNNSRRRVRFLTDEDGNLLISVFLTKLVQYFFIILTMATGGYVDFNSNNKKPIIANTNSVGEDDDEEMQQQELDEIDIGNGAATDSSTASLTSASGLSVSPEVMAIIQPDKDTTISVIDVVPTPDLKEHTDIDMNNNNNDDKNNNSSELKIENEVQVNQIQEIDMSSPPIVFIVMEEAKNQTNYSAMDTNITENDITSFPPPPKDDTDTEDEREGDENAAKLDLIPEEESGMSSDSETMSASSSCESMIEIIPGEKLSGPPSLEDQEDLQLNQDDLQLNQGDLQLNQSDLELNQEDLATAIHNESPVGDKLSVSPYSSSSASSISEFVEENNNENDIKSLGLDSEIICFDEADKSMTCFEFSPAIEILEPLKPRDIETIETEIEELEKQIADEIKERTQTVTIEKEILTLNDNENGGNNSDKENDSDKENENILKFSPMINDAISTIDDKVLGQEIPANINVVEPLNPEVGENEEEEEQQMVSLRVEEEPISSVALQIAKWESLAKRLPPKKSATDSNNNINCGSNNNITCTATTTTTVCSNGQMNKSKIATAVGQNGHLNNHNHKSQSNKSSIVDQRSTSTVWNCWNKSNRNADDEEIIYAQPNYNASATMTSLSNPSAVLKSHPKPSSRGEILSWFNDGEIHRSGILLTSSSFGLPQQMNNNHINNHMSICSSNNNIHNGNSASDGSPVIAPVVVSWFYGLITRVQAEKFLHGQPTGTFLVRISTRIWGYTLSYQSNQRTKHFLISAENPATVPPSLQIDKTSSSFSPKSLPKPLLSPFASQGRYAFIGTNMTPYTTLASLIRHHSHAPITKSGGEKLLFPCPGGPQLTGVEYLFK